MATRSTIAISTPDGITAIYCHWDGYPEGVGATLKSHYTDKDSVASLIAKGGISSLGNTLNETEFYTDRGEELEVKKFETGSEWLEWAKACECEFAYRFTGITWHWEAI